MPRTASPRAIPFVAAHEGIVLRAYRDAGGVVTIGIGFTMLSKVFADHWRGKHGRALRMGDMIDRDECTVLLGRLLAAEYAPPVDRAFDDAITRHAFDAATSVVYNCGAGTLKDKWAKALAAGDVARAASLLRSTRVTAGGKRLKGLERRRADEARLLAAGDYGGRAARPSVSRTPDEIRAYREQLIALGYLPAAGGSPEETARAVVKFQADSRLTVDGIVGPATRAALARAAAARRTGQGVAGGAAGGGAVGGGSDPSFDWQTLFAIGKWALIAGGLIFAAALAWRYRGVILRRRTPA